MIKATMFNFSTHEWEVRVFKSLKELSEFENDDYNWKHFTVMGHEEFEEGDEE